MFQEPNIMHDITENCYFFLFIDLDKCAWWYTMESDDEGEVVLKVSDLEEVELDDFSDTSDEEVELDDLDDLSERMFVYIDRSIRI